MKPELSAPVKDGHRLTSPENLFRFQSEVIRKLAEVWEQQVGLPMQLKN